MATDLSGLNRFIDKLEKVSDMTSNSSSLLERVVREVASEGENYLRMLYGMITISDTNENNPPNVTYAMTSNNSAEIIAYGNGGQVAFIEFGTGLKGDGTYKGITPKSGVPYTGYWEYNFDSGYKRPNRNDRQYWYYRSSINNELIKTSGMIAGNQIYDTARYLEKKIPEIVAKIVQEELA